MILSRLLSLLISTALVACPSVCRVGTCSAGPQEQEKPVTCSQCPANSPASTGQNGTDETSPSGVPSVPSDPCCNFGNCLCAGALVDHGGLELQIGHALGMFSAVAAAGVLAHPLGLSAAEFAFPDDQHDSQASGRRLRLRIESLLL